MSKKILDNLGVSAFCESMGMMVQAGIQTDEAIALLQQENKAGAGVLAGALLAMKTETEAGASLSEAMKASGVFPSYALDMTAGGEKSGRLEDVLFRLSRYYADQKIMSEKLKNAVTYPAAMLVLIIAVLSVMLTMVLPAFTGVYDKMTGSLATSAYSYIRGAYAVCWVALILMVILALILIIGYICWQTGKTQLVKSLLCRIPICRSILENLAMFRFSSALNMYLASGEMQDEAVEMSVAMVDYAPVEAKLNQCRASMKEGHSLAQAAYDENLFEPIYGRMLLAGERSGNAEKVLARLTELLAENCTGLVDRLVGIVDPLLSGVIIVTVGLSLLSVMLPLIGIMNTIG